MTDAELRRRLTDLPANARPWTSDRWVRQAAGADVWYCFLPREYVRCPKCSRGVPFSVDQGIAIRIHPEQRRTGPELERAGPTSVRGVVRTCKSCGTHLDIRYLPVAKVVEALPCTPEGVKT